MNQIDTNAYDSSLIGQRQLRIAKLNQLREMGIEPYPAKAVEAIHSADVINKFAELENTTVTVSGRLMTWREHGALKFADLQDTTGSIQLYLRQDMLQPFSKEEQRLGWEELSLLDIADYIQATGTVTKTIRGEISLLVSEMRILTKALRPLPDKWHGIKDIEERFRRRYVDMTVNPEVRERMERRSLFWKAHRDFFNSRGFYEVNIPILEHIPGGGDAVPFITHMNAIDEDFYLRISHELPLKRLIGAGFERVYDIGARFRNEGLSDEHLPEHVAMEFYWAYADWKDGMKFIKELYQHILTTVYGGRTKFSIRGFEVDFANEWKELDFAGLMREHYGIQDVYTVKVKELIPHLDAKGIDYDPKTINVPRAVDSLWKQVRKTIAGPAFLVNHPKFLSPLQKASTTNPNMVERFQPIIAGSELGNGWSEVNDPVDQYERFVEQQKLRDAGDQEAQWLDIDYVEMLEYGMAPTFGYGHSERVFWFLEDVTAREGVPFPQLKFQVSEMTKEIYPEVDFDHLRDSTQAQTTVSDGMDISLLPQLTMANIQPETNAAYPDVHFGYVVIEGLSINPENDDLNQLKEVVSKDIRGKFKNIDEIRSIPSISGYREVYRAFGADPTSTLNSAEALLKRIVDGKDIYTINTLVDSYNITSAQLNLAMAAYDMDRIEGEISLRLAEEGETIRRIGESDSVEINPGALVYADSQGVICMNFNYRDAERTKITSATKRAILFVDGNKNISPNEIQNALGVLASRVMQFNGGKLVGWGLVPTQVSSESQQLEVGSLPSHEDALAFVHKYVQDPYQRHHAEMVEAAMRAIAKRLGENEDLFGLTGLVHDWDFDQWPETHPSRYDQLQSELGVPDSVVDAIKGHADLAYPRKTKLAQALLAADEFSGLLYAYMKMVGRFGEMQVPSIAKKVHKDLKFAAKANREDMKTGIAELGIPEEEFFALIRDTFAEKYDE